jgi:hypothetical protein
VKDLRLPFDYHADYNMVVTGSVAKGRLPMRAISWLSAFFALSPAIAQAQQTTSQTTSDAQVSVGTGGVSALWVLANISYAGMRAQRNPSTGWRIVAFLFGFPGTLVSWLAVPEGGERAYGVDIPRRRL